MGSVYRLIIKNNAGDIHDRRPKNLNFFTIKFPMSAIMSVGHRAAGILLFFSLPYYLYLLQLSLSDEAGFILAKELLQQPLDQFMGLMLSWALIHHFLAGIRYFFLDFDLGIKKNQAQNSAMGVMISGFLVFLLLLLFVS
jgi:succinate dehydrogenase / fumarate reductase cytochrome b subunit